MSESTRFPEEFMREARQPNPVPEEFMREARQPNPVPEELMREARQRLEGSTDADLLRRYAGGEDDAFATLVRRHKDRLWAVALRTMRSSDEAAEALQEALISAARRAGQYRGDAAVLPWLHRIVINACLDRLRRNTVRATQPVPEDADRDLSFADGDDPEGETALVEMRREVIAALRQLNPDQRAALILVDMEAYSVDEAGEILGCAPWTITSRCARGRAKLVPLLSHVSLS